MRSAIDKLEKLSVSRGPVALRLRVDSGGCGGFSYHFDVIIDSEVKPEDKVFKQDGQQVVVDELSLSFLKDCQIDYHEEMVRSAFRVAKNAMAESSCGCAILFQYGFRTDMFARRVQALFATPPRFNPVEVAKKTRRKRQLYLLAGVTLAVGTFDYKFRECLDVVGNPAGVQDPHKLFFARMFFGRLRSKIIGTLMEREVPVGMRASLYSTYAKATGVNLDEMRYPIDSYRTVQDFFTRPLKKDVRPMASTDPLCLVSPADSEVIACGDVTSDRLPQVKGTTYSLKGFLGMDPTKTIAASGKSAPVLKYIVLYLCPGDYHRFHSPTRFHVTNAKHFSGEVISVNKAALHVLNDIFSVNERIVLGGAWSQGNMWYTAVAAHGVGNIKLSFENKLRTNDPRMVPVYCGGDIRDRVFDQHLEFGDEVGMFKLGSTIVMVFEASKNMEWTVKEGDHVKVGDLLLRPAKNA